MKVTAINETSATSAADWAVNAAFSGIDPGISLWSDSIAAKSPTADVFANLFPPADSGAGLPPPDSLTPTPDPGALADQAALVTDFTNVSFSLTDDNGNAHQLDINSQMAQANGAVTFTGEWNGQGGTVTLAYDAAGNVHVTFSADNYNFDGTISGVAGVYHIDGNLTGADGNSVHAAGDQAVAQVAPVTDFTNVTFALTDDSGAAHQLQIQTQTAQPDGSATFQGVWDGQDGAGEQVNGTLSYDAAGNVHIAFSGDHESFDGSLSGDPGAYQLNGNLQTQAPAAPMADFTNVPLSLTDDSGTIHQLQITSQVTQPDGSATFQGVWDGQDGAGEQVTGTLSYDEAGNIHVAFNGDNESFDGSLSGDPGAYHLDGTLKLSGVGQAPGADPTLLAALAAPATPPTDPLAPTS
jgi:hypothetical protein